MNKRITKRDRRRLAFRQEVYEALRELEEKKITTDSVCVAVGKLTPVATVVYDRIVRAAERLESKTNA